MSFSEGPVFVPLDGSKASEVAVAPALQLAQAYGAPLRFAYVIDLEQADDTPLAEFEGRFADYVRTFLHEREADAVEHTAEVFVGSPAATLLNEAADARIVVMATHGRGGFHATFIGSVTDKLVRGCAQPVLTVPVQGVADIKAGPVLVGLDGSEAAEAGLAAARDVSRRLSTGLTLLRSYSAVIGGATELAFYQPDTVDMIREAAEAYLAQVAREGEQTMTALTSPSIAIEQAAEELNVGVVVLTSHGRGLAGRLALGSVTDRVLHSLRRPILVVPSDWHA